MALILPLLNEHMFQPSETYIPVLLAGDQPNLGRGHPEARCGEPSVTIVSTWTDGMAHPLQLCGPE